MSNANASSDYGVQGVVTINTPGVDPNQGITILPTNLVDAASLVTARCRPNTEAAVRFIVTGRGGIPTTPSDLLSPDTIWLNTPHLSSDVQAMAPAQGWVKQNGQVLLVSHPVATGCPE